MKQAFLECGMARSAHGVRGLFKTESFCDSPKVLAKLKTVYTKKKDGTFAPHDVTSATVAGDLVILGISDVETREDAVAFSRTVLYAKREDLPLKKGAFFLADVIGLPVFDATDGRKLGTVKSIDDVPTGKMYTVETEKGDVLVPDIPVFLKEINPDVGVYLTPIPGMFDDEI